MCVQTGLRVLNGRTRGDFTGQLTCHNIHGSSIVDYFIVSEDLLKEITFFKVHSFLADLSDHCQISVMININMNNSRLDGMSGSKQLAPPKYVWDDDSMIIFQSALVSDSIKKKISCFMSEVDSDSQTMTSNLNDIISEAADMSVKKISPHLKIPKHAPCVKKKKTKWFDFSLVQMRK